MNISKITVHAHSDDRNSYQVIGSDGSVIHSHEGYHPRIKNLCGGDDAEFEIDNETGKIIGWVPLTEESFKEAFDIQDNED